MRAYVTTALNALKHPAGETPATVIFVGAFFYFLCSQIMTNSTFIYHVGFYGLLLPSFLYITIKQRSLIRSIPYNVGTLSFIAFFAFVLGHTVLGQFADQSLLKTFGDTLLNSLFVIMALSIFANPRIDSLMLLRSFIITAIIMIPISYALFAHTPNPTHHFLPIGRAHNPIPLGNLYAFAALLSLWLFFQAHTTTRWKMLCSLCYVLVVAAIILTTQRGPLLGLLVASGVAILLLCRLRTIACASMGAVVLGLDYVAFYTSGTSMLHLDALYGTITHFLTQRDSIRLIIWQHAFERIAEHPWRGYGLQATFVMEGLPGAVNPHNLFISTLYYLGIVGLGLLLVPLIAAVAVAFKHRRNPYHQLCLIMLVHAVVATFTNYGQVVKAPYALWTIYWLPIAMSLARPLSKQSRYNSCSN